MNLQNKVIVVTGGSKGLGRELVLNLLQHGTHVAAIARSETSLAETAKLAGESAKNLSTHIVDISDQKAIEKLPKEITTIHGNIDGIINNAGIIQPFVRVNDLDYEKIDQVMGTNFWGPLYMIKTFLPILLKRPEAHIVNIVSMGGFFPVPGQTVYGASKAALKLLSEGLATELLKTNVKVTTVFPGAIGTNIAENSGVEISDEMKKMQGSVKLLSPQKAAQIIISAIEHDRMMINVGTDAKMMSLLYRLFPQKAPLIFSKYMGDKLMGK